MSSGLRKTFLSIVCILGLFFLRWFLWIYIKDTSEDPINLYSNLYGVIPLIGGIYGLFLSRHWGGWNSKVGRAVMLLSLGLITWGIGIVIWLYYNIIMHVEVPYPSLADAAFILSWPLWG